MVNKKAQDLSIGTLILIVLGIIVLVLLILGFSMGWGNLWEKINIFGGSSSIGDVATSCNLAITSNNLYDYCQTFKKVKVGSQTEYVSCKDPRLQLNGALNCGDTDYVKEKCIALYKTSQVDTKTIVNGNTCTSLNLACEDANGFNGKISPSVNGVEGKCPPPNAAAGTADAGKIVGIKDYSGKTGTNDVCCVAP